MSAGSERETRRVDINALKRYIANTETTRSRRKVSGRNKEYERKIRTGKIRRGR